MNVYEITITRNGTLCETWEAESPSKVEAILACRAARIAAGDHAEGDRYKATRCEVSDAVALAFAFFDAARHLPELYAVDVTVGATC